MRANERSIEVKYYYIRDDGNNPVACCATISNGEQVRFALSVKNPLDDFKKSQARGIAATRVLTLPDNPRVKEPVVGYSLSDFGGYLPAEGFTKRKLLQVIMNNSKIPSRARKAARDTIRYFDFVNSLPQEDIG